MHTLQHISDKTSFLQRKLSALPLLFFLVWAQPPGPVFPQNQPKHQELIVEQIEIVGNDKTHRGVILSYLNFAEGDAISPAQIEQSWQQLENTHFFKEIEFYTRTKKKKGKLVVVMEVQERRWPYFQFEGGHSDLNGWYFVPVSLRFDNLLGHGNFGGIRIFVGDRLSKLSFNYFTPKLFSGAGYLDVELFGGGRQYLYYLNARQVVHQVDFGGLNVRLGGNHGLFKHISFGMRTYNYRPRSTATFSENDSTITATSLPTAIADGLTEKRIAAFSLGLHADLRDRIAYPLNGFWGAVTAEKADNEFNSEIDFERFTFDARFYKNLFGGQVFALNFKGGFVSEQAPFYERFYLGGANSVRGYAERRLTPIGYASKLLQGSAELRIPFAEPKTPNQSPAYAVLFFDIGGAWLSSQEPDANELYNSFGFGFRFNVPIIGLTRFDFAFPAETIDNTDFKFHISLGHSF